MCNNGGNRKIEVESLEVHVSNHCNLSCKGCSHLSPLEEVAFLNVQQICKVLKILNKYLHCNVIRLLGGEPTLNGSLEEIVIKIKEIGISTKISIPTNGIMLNKISNKTIEEIDMVEISNYHYSDDKTRQISEWCKMAKKVNNNIDIYMYMYQYFREPCAFNNFTDLKTVERIYKTCIIAHDWQCFNVYGDYIFRCPVAIAISKNMEGESINKNGLRISEEEGFKVKLKKYLFDKQPLSACKYCLGSCGKLIPIEQIARDKQIQYLKEPIEGKLDNECLRSALNQRMEDMGTIEKIIKF